MQIVFMRRKVLEIVQIENFTIKKFTVITQCTSKIILNVTKLYAHKLITKINLSKIDLTLPIMKGKSAFFLIVPYTILRELFPFRWQPHPPKSVVNLETVY